MNQVIAFFIGLTVGMDLFFFIVWKRDTIINLLVSMYFIISALVGTAILINMSLRV